MVLEEVISHPRLLLSRKDEPFSGYAVILDDGSKADGPLDQVLTSLDTMHTVTADDLLLILPGRWDIEAVDTYTKWSSVSSYAYVGAPIIEEGMPGEDYQASVLHGESGESVPDNVPSELEWARMDIHRERTRQVIEFVHGGKDRRREVRVFSIIGVNGLLDWLGVGSSVLPSVLILSPSEQQAAFVDGGKALGIVELFRKIRDRMEQKDHADLPIAAALAVGAEHNLEKSQLPEFAFGDWIAWHLRVPSLQSPSLRPHRT
jgi:hypothetical protein